MSTHITGHKTTLRLLYKKSNTTITKKSLLGGTLKTTKTVFLVFITLVSLWAKESSLTINFKTASYNGRFAPDHCIAVWVTDESGKFIKTLQINGRYPKYRNMLSSWLKASDYDSTDATTSASLFQHRAHQIQWDLTDRKGAKVPKGSYKVWIEQTEDNSIFPGMVPLAELDIEIGDQSSELTFDPVVHKSKNAISNISLSLFINGASTITKNLADTQSVFSVKEGLLSFTNTQKEVAISILNSRGQILLSGTARQGKFSVASLPKGFFVAQIREKSGMTTVPFNL